MPFRRISVGAVIESIGVLLACGIPRRALPSVKSPATNAREAGLAIAFDIRTRLMYEVVHLVASVELSAVWPIDDQILLELDYPNRALALRARAQMTFRWCHAPLRGC